jgi:hypothetical protein
LFRPCEIPGNELTYKDSPPYGSLVEAKQNLKKRKMKNYLFYMLCTIACSTLFFHTDAQVLRKFKEKVNQAADKALAGKTTPDGTAPTEGSPQNTESTGRTGKPTNKTGAGLVSTPPDVDANMTSSETNFKSNKYSESRYALQQAILGVELKIGQEILKSMPEELLGLPKIPESDKVASGGWGWTGLTINREYQKGDKFMGVSIQDFSYLGPAWAMYFNGGMMNTQMENNEQKMKNIMVKGNKGVISFDASKGYTVVVMLTQGSALVWDGVNFASEEEMMTAVNSFDIDKIKNFLGEK